MILAKQVFGKSFLNIFLAGFRFVQADVIVVVNNPDILGKLANFFDDFLLHEVDAHRKDGQAHQQVDAGQDQLGLPLIRLEFKKVF